jgi:cytosine/creatinine deaminase
MGTGFAAIPTARRWRLRDVAAPVCLIEGLSLSGDAEGLARLDIEIADGRINGIARAGELPADCVNGIDLAGAMVWPGLVDAHTHLDKGHIWPRSPNPDGTFMGALAAVEADRSARWSAADVARRMEFALRCAYAHGTVAVRTHLDSLGPQIGISWPVFAEIQANWRGRIALQAVSLTPIDLVMDDAEFAAMLQAVREHKGVLGAVTYMSPHLDAGLDRLFRAAAAHDLALDFHVDETLDPNARSLRRIAETKRAQGFAGPVMVGHCCSLSRQPADEADQTMDLVAQAGLSVVSLPLCNIYLQDRAAGQTPRARGVTLLHELKARGVNVVVASDNTRDPFYAYGDLDALEVYRVATRVAHFDHPVGDWPRTVAANAARAINVSAGSIRIGAPADLVICKARRFTELLARPQADRIVLRHGKAIDTTLPDYAELDDLMVRQ